MINDERDKAKEYINEYETFQIVTFYQEEIPKVANAGWVHKIIDKK